MVDPDHVGVVDGNGIASPDVLGVDVGDGNVPAEVRLCALQGVDSVPGTEYAQVWTVDLLDDDVAGTADDTETLTLDDTGGARAQNSLVGGDGDTEAAGVVT
jgi:hypothetical protein